jgi:hypothetical protein
LQTVDTSPHSTRSIFLLLLITTEKAYVVWARVNVIKMKGLHGLLCSPRAHSFSFRSMKLYLCCTYLQVIFEIQKTCLKSNQTIGKSLTQDEYGYRKRIQSIACQIGILRQGVKQNLGMVHKPDSEEQKHLGITPSHYQNNFYGFFVFLIGYGKKGKAMGTLKGNTWKTKQQKHIATMYNIDTSMANKRQ